jgi:protein-tyrosine phosphatase
VSDYHEVAPRLWMGAAPDSKRPYSEFDAIVLCAGEVQPTFVRFQGTIIRAPFVDSGAPTATERKIAIRAAREVAKRLRRGQSVLVTCAMGLNRSGLVCGLALKMVSPYHVSEIIDRIRKARGKRALSNPAFERFLRGFSSKKSRQLR